MSLNREESGAPANRMRPVHPGEILADELEEIGLSIRAFAAALDVDPTRISEIVKGKRHVTADTALRLARYFGTSAKFWLNLQTSYDLKVAEAANGEKISLNIKPREAA